MHSKFRLFSLWQYYSLLIFLFGLGFFIGGGVLKRISGIIFFAGYVFFTGSVVYKQLVSKLIEIKIWTGTVLGMFVSLIFLSLLTSIVLYFCNLQMWILALIFSIHFLVILFLLKLPSDEVSFFYSLKKYLPNNKSNIFEIKKNYVFILLLITYFLLIGVGFYLLVISKTGIAIQSPWQTIHPAFIYIFFSTSILLGLLFYNKNISISLVIFLAIIHSLLLHSFLPLSHEFLYGADQWRHSANEIRFLHGEPFLKPTLSSDVALSFVERFDFGLVSYGELWSMIVLCASFFGNSILFLNKWFIPILWSIIFPTLLYVLSFSIGWHNKKIKLLILCSFLPFTWIAGGSLTLPNSLGFLSWLVLFLLLILRVKNPHSKKILVFVALGFISSLFGYSLYALLFGVLWFLAEVMLKTENGSSFYKKYIVRFAASIIAACSIPVLEIIAKFSYFNLQHAWIQEFKQLIGNFTGIYLAFGPRPHDIDGGNIIFNQIPLAAFVPNVFTASRLWIVFFMVIFFLLVGIGILRTLKNKTIVNSFLVYTTFSITLMYGIGRYVLEGNQVLSRRLEHVVAFFWIIFFVQGMGYIYTLLSTRSLVFKRTALIVVGVLLLASATAASFSLGPDIQTISRSDYEAAEYIWKEEKNNTTHCVIADTYPLLALEFISQKQIIGGGFPIDQNFTQRERVKLFTELQKNSNENIWNEALEITKTKQCWLVASKNNFQNTIYSLEFQKDFILFGNILVWKYTRVKSL